MNSNTEKNVRLVGAGLVPAHIKGKTQKGITLIALVITIIVLLILAGVTISMVLGDDGIIQNVQAAKQATEKGEDKEEEALFQANREFAKYNIPKYDDVKDDTTKLATKNSTFNGQGASSSNPVIPEGFMPVNPDVDTTVTTTWGTDAANEGLVIQDEAGNQFVWVPVPNIADFAVLQTGTTNYRGQLWAEFIGNAFGTKKTTFNPNDGLREPAVVTGNSYGTGTSYDGHSANIKAIKEEKYSTLLEQFQTEYNYMVASVKAYGGFYVGRYETSLIDGKVASKGNIPTSQIFTAATDLGTSWITSNSDNKASWYGLYDKQKELYERDSNSSVVSGMIYGCEWDAIMNWMLSSEDTTVSTFVTDSREMGNYTGFSKPTGSNPAYAVNNIYDLSGNYFEWTQEAYGTGSRIPRGGYYSNNGSDRPVSDRYNFNPASANVSFSSRLQLYIK